MPVSKSSHPEYKRLSIKPIHLKSAEILYFSSIITEFTDSWTPRWSPTNVYGRMDPVSFYGGTGRELTFGFRVISDDRAEASENMRKIQKLIQYQYPLYSKHGGTGIQLLTAPPYFEIKFMNVVGGGTGKSLRGYVNGALQINPGFQAKDQAQYFSAGNDKIYFSDVNIVLRMQILHEGTVGWSSATSFIKGANYPYGAAGSPPPSPPPSPDPGASNSGNSDPASSGVQVQKATGGTKTIVVDSKAAASAAAARNKRAQENQDNLEKAQMQYGSGKLTFKGRGEPTLQPSMTQQEIDEGLGLNEGAPSDMHDKPPEGPTPYTSEQIAAMAKAEAAQKKAAQDAAKKKQKTLDAAWAAKQKKWCAEATQLGDHEGIKKHCKY